MVSMYVVSFVLCVNYTICGFVGVIANSAVLLTIHRSRKENSAFKKTLASLSTSNLIASFCFSISGCIFAYHFVSQRISVNYSCVLIALQYSNRYATSVSFLHIVLITIQKLAAILFPFHFKRIFTTKVTYVIIFLIWITGFAMISRYQLVVMTGGRPDYALSYSIIAIGVMLLISYSWIFHRLLKRESLSKQPTNYDKDQSYASNKSNTFIDSIGLSLLSIFVMIPCIVFVVFVLSGSTMSELYILFTSLLALKTICDPLVYLYIARCKLIRRREEERNALTLVEVSM